MTKFSHGHLGIVSKLLTLVGMSIAVACSAPAGSDEGTASSTDEQIRGGTPARNYAEAALVDIYVKGTLVGYCSGAVIAPRVVLTAGHCARGQVSGASFDGWQITAPYASGQASGASVVATYDYVDDGTDLVHPRQHDLALIFLDKPILLSTYPQIAQVPYFNQQGKNIGRRRNNVLSLTDLFEGANIKLAADPNLPFDYGDRDVIDPGDSGGPVVLAGTHTIVAVNSGAARGADHQVLARTDLVASWISQQIAAHADPNACVASLSGIGAGDFHVEATVTTRATGVTSSILFQRDVCGHETFWDVRMGASGNLAVETDDGTNYTAFWGTRAINDGVPHAISIARARGELTLMIDGVVDTAAPSSSSFGSLPPLRIASGHPCGTGGVDLVGTVENVCLRTR